MTVEALSTGLSALKDAATIVAIVAGGIWTYYLFVKNRQRHPRLSIALATEFVPLSDRRGGEPAIATEESGTKQVEGPKKPEP